MTGSWQADGALLLSGSAGPANPILIGAEFRDVLIKQDPQLGLTGTFTYTTLHPDGPASSCLACAGRRRCRLARFTPSGEYVTRSWSGDCPFFEVSTSGLSLADVRHRRIHLERQVRSSITSGELWHMVRQIL